MDPIIDPQEPVEPIEPVTEPVEPIEPAVPTFTQADIQAARDEARAQALAEARPAQPVQPVQPDPFAEAAELMYSDPAAALRMVAEATRRETLAQVAPLYSRINERDVVSEIAGDLHDEAKQYVKGFANSVDVTNLTPQVRELLRNAAENKDRAARSRVKAEPTSIQPDVQVNIDDFASYNNDRAQWNLPALSKAEYAQLAREN